MGFTVFLLDYIPMYDKFRAVSSILVIAEFTIPLLAVLALKEVMARPQLVKEQARSFYISLGLTGGIAFIVCISSPVFFFPVVCFKYGNAGIAGYSGRSAGSVTC